MLVRILRTGVWPGLTATAGVISWQAAAVIASVLVASGVLRLLTEWQRRATLRALLAGAPGGTVVMEGDTPGGQFMKVTLGSPVSQHPPARS